MEKEVKVSVIVAVYNTAKYLPACLKSLEKAADSERMEVIFVDDASTDGSSQLLDAYALGRRGVMVIHKKENEATLLSRVSGMEAAKGEYVCFVDSDDYVSPDMFEKMYAHAKQTGADIIECGYYSERPEGSEPCHDRAIGEYDTHEIVESYTKRRANSALWLRMYARDVVLGALKTLWSIRDDRSYFKGIRIEDEILCPLLLMQGSHYETIEDLLYHYREGSAGSNMKGIDEDADRKLEHCRFLLFAGKMMLKITPGAYRGLFLSMQVDNLFYLLGQMLQNNRKDTDHKLWEAMREFRRENRKLPFRVFLRYMHLRWKYGRTMR